MRLPGFVALLGAVALVPAAALGQDASTSPAAPPDCTGPEFRQFDFWVGDWNVTVKEKQAGTNDVVLTLDGCLVQEHWVGKGGSVGQSFNFYDRTDGKWHQVWVDNAGGTLFLEGSVQRGTMVLVGGGLDPKGKPILNRITWTPDADGSVRQLWDTSSDNGQNWEVAFDGLYRLKSK